MDISIVSAMVKIFVAILLGMYLRKKDFFPEGMSGKLSSLVVNYTLPALIIYSVCNTGSGNSMDVLKLFGMGILLYLMLPVIALVFSKAARIRKEDAGSYQMLLIYGNISFMGIPVVQSIYGDIAVFYLSLLHMMFNFSIFTYGIYLVSKGDGKEKLHLKNVLNTGTISCILALAIYFSGIKIPVIISDSLNFIGGITTPLSMLILGYILGGYDIREIFREKKIYLMSIMKLLVFPLLAYLVSTRLFTDPVIIGVITLTVGMPSGSLCVMLSEQYGGNTRLLSIGVFVTTLLSLVTIPIIYFLTI